MPLKFMFVKSVNKRRCPLDQASQRIAQLETTLRELLDLLNEYAPTWFTQEKRDKVVAVLAETEWANLPTISSSHFVGIFSSL